ncbi:hypothetical protein AUG19_02250 [archaeon 13_1_20CM_2_54_9]|nr:MAG: hypothetical protein AUJ07_03940 [Crenarchaeota archaeon 13_1_40CM_3_53_5]OLE76668.1 MAG: hypothetical protein AUG19_02250 [archaeon 13_1_20CM_2_54_9]
MAIGEAKIPCPTHGRQAVRVQHYNGPGGVPRGEWHKCGKCDFKFWLRVSAMAGVTIGMYVQNVLVYTKILS